MQQKIKKNYCFLDNYIWIACRKLSLLQGEYLSLEPNVLPNVWFQTSLRETLSKSISLRVMKKYDKIAFMEILEVFSTL